MAAESDLGLAKLREIPAVNGGATVEGSLHMMTGGAVTLNGGATITGDLLVPGTPVVRINGKPAYGGTVDGAGPATPSNYTITLNGQACLRNVIRRTAPVVLATVPPPPAPAGTRSVTLNTVSQPVGDWTTLRNLTLNGSVGQIAVPPGAYGDFIANGGSGFTLGIAGSTTPAVYNLQRLTVNGQARIEIVGPVVLNLANGLAANGAIGSSARPDWLALNISSGGLTLNGGCAFHAFVTAPAIGSGTVLINGNSMLMGGLVADKLIVNGGGLLRLRPGGGTGPANTAPVAASQSLSTAEDVALPITLGASDAENDVLSYRLVSLPAAGSLTHVDGSPLPALGSALSSTSLRYTPAVNATGSVSFTFRVRDSAGLESNLATVSIAITPVNDVPTAEPLSVHTSEDVSVAITLGGADPEGAELVHAIVQPPAHGSLTGVPPALTYLPDADYHGADAFAYTVTDTQGAVSSPATVSIAVDPINDIPVAQAQALEIREDEPVLVALAATDVDGQELSYAVAALPAFGTLTLADGTAIPSVGAELPPSVGGAVVRYVPGPNYHGADVFAFTASDGIVPSAPAAIQLAVLPVNDTPVAFPGDATTPEDMAVMITLAATDVDGDSPDYAIVAEPSHGTVVLSSGVASYTPARDYHGSDSFVFAVTDHAGAVSASATIAITVTAENDAPVAVSPPGLATAEDMPLTLTLSGDDIDGDSVTYSITTAPAHGTLGGAAPHLVYTPAADYSGSDSFAYIVTDPSGATSAPALVSVSVSPVNDTPVAEDAAYIVGERQTLSLVLAADDADGDALTFTLTSAPSAGTLSGTPPNLVYAPPANTDVGVTFTFVATDGHATSAPATIRIEVRNVPDAPVAQAQTLTLSEDTSMALTIAATDPEDDALTYEILVPPAHGVLSGATPALVYTPDANFHGADAVTFVARDAVLQSAPAVVSFVVTSVNDAPIAFPQSLSTAEDGVLALTLAGSDADGDPLGYAVVTPPTHGSLSGTAPHLIYTPEADYHGPDNFAFAVSDTAGATSAPVSISLQIASENDAPRADPPSVYTTRNTAVLFETGGTDPDGDSLVARIVTGPTNGTVTINGSNVTYTPAPDYIGADTFVFLLNDGQIDSAPITATITVREVNLAPVVDAGPDRLMRFTPRRDGAPTGRIVVNNDEWVITDTGFQSSPYAGLYARNLADFLTGGKPGARFFAYTATVPGSVDFAYTGAALAQVMNQAGHTFIKSGTFPATLAEMLQYDAIFLCANIVDNQLLIDYVEAGGSVYLSAGTKWCGCDAHIEAGWWNAFLNYFGLNFTFPYNGVLGTFPIVSDHPLLAGVQNLYFGNGNSIGLLIGENGESDPYAQIVYSRGREGLLAVYGNQSNQVFLRGTASDDGRPNPPGALSYAWTQIEGAPAEIESPHTLVTRVTFPQSGVYRFRFSASDGEFAPSDEVTITLNQAPQVEAGPPAILGEVGQIATFAGSVSDDGVRDPLQIRWNQVAGHGAVYLGSPLTPTTTVAVDEPGIYLLELSADDGLETSTDVTELRVALNTWPSPDSLVAWWPFNGELNDVVAGAYRFHAASPPDYVSARVSRGLRFSSNLDEYILSTGSSLDLGAFPAGFSIEFWARTPELRDGTILSFGQTEVPGLSIQQVNGGRDLYVNLRERTSGADHVINGISLPAVDTWFHVALTFDRVSGEARIYIDGILRRTVAWPPFAVRTEGSLALGRNAWNFAGAWLGDLDELSFYRRPLSVAEIRGIVRADAHGKSVSAQNSPPQVDAGRACVLPSVDHVLTLAGSVVDDGFPLGRPSQHWAQVDGPAQAIFDSPTSLLTDVRFTVPGIYLLSLEAYDGYAAPVADYVEVRVGVEAERAAPGLAAWWPLNAHSREVLNGRADLELFNGLHYGAGHPVQGLLYDGTDDFARASAHADLDVGVSAEGFTIELWVKPAVYRDTPLAEWGTMTGSQTFFAQWNAGRGLYAFLQGEDGAWRSIGYDGAITLNEWQHVAMTYDRASGWARLYRNGIMLREQNLGSFGVRTTQDFYVGARPREDRWFVGALDEPTLYARPLGVEEIVRVCRAGAAGKAPLDGNLPPTVSAGPDQVLADVAGVAALLGEVTDDGLPEGGALSARWTQLSGPGVASFADPALSETTATFSAPGIYTLQLRAYDGLLAVSDVMEVRVQVSSVQLQSIAAWWPLNSHAREVVNNTSALELFNGLDYAEGRVAQGLLYDGADDFARASAHANLDVGSSEQGFTIELWICPTVYRDTPLLEWGTTNGAQAFFAEWNAGQGLYAFLQGEDGAWRSIGYDGAITLNEWQHVAVTYDRTSGWARLYRNGVMLREQNLGSFAVRTKQDLYIGARPREDRCFVGSLDEPTLYARPLASDEIAGIYHAEAAGKAPLDGNSPPTVSAGPDRVLADTASIAALSGEVVDDGLPAGLDLEVRWTQLAGPGQATFSDAAAATTTATFSAPGVYVLRLRAHDGLLTADDLVEVRVGLEIERPAPGLSAWWSLNGHPREVVNGRAGLELFNGLGYGTGRVAQGLDYDGTNDFARAAAHADHDVGEAAEGFTIELWVKPAAYRDTPLVEWGATTGTQTFFAQWSGGRGLYAFLQGADGATRSIGADSVFTLDQWQHVAVTYDRTSGWARLYRNGVMLREQNLGSFAVRTKQDLYIGARPREDRWFVGALDEPTLYARPLVTAEILRIYQAEAAGKAPLDGNLPPTVSAGPDRVLADTASIATLSGEVTDDGLPAGLDLDVLWTQLAGPGQATFSDATAAATTATFSAPGVYVLQLRAHDGILTATDTMEVRVQTAPATLPQPVAAWWPLNGNPREVVNGRAGLELFNGLDYGAGRVAQGLAYDGTNDFARAAAHADHDVGGSSEGFTIELWICPTVYRDTPLVEWGTASGAQAFFAEWNAGQGLYAFLQGEDGAWRSIGYDGAITLNEWQHVAVTYDRTSGWARLYRNGVMLREQNLGSFAVRTKQDLYIGARPREDRWFVGALDEPTLYARPLTPSEMLAIYQAGADGKAPVPENEAPQVSVPAALSALCGHPIVLSALVSDDGLPAGSALSATWTQISGPASAVFASASSASTEVTFSEPGAYVLRIYLSDTRLMAQADTTVTVTYPLPEVTLTDPVDGATLAADRLVTLRAEATVSTGAIERVEFYNGTILLGVATAPAPDLGPSVYSLAVPSGFPAGGHVLTARAIAALSGATTTSPPVNVTAVPYSGPEVVELSAPLDGARLTAPAEFTGIVSRAGLESWKLEYRLTPDDPGASAVAAPWISLATGTNYVGTPASGSDAPVPGPLSTFDPTLLRNGLYQVRLSASSTNGTTLYDFVRTVLVDGKLKLGVIDSTVVDLEMPAPGFPLRIERHYSSADHSSGDFGPGTTLASSALRLQLPDILGADWFGYMVAGPLGIPLYRVDPAPPEDATGVPPAPRIVAITLPDQTVLRFEADITPKQQIAPITEAHVLFRPLTGTMGTLVPLDAALGVNTEVVLGNVTGELDLLDPSTGAPIDPAAYRLTTLDGTEYIIASGGSLLSQRDSNGNSITYTRDAIIHSNGLRLDLVRDAAGRITRVVDSAGRQINYAYDLSGRLLSVTNAAGEATTYGYVGGSSLVVSVQPPAAVRPTYNAFDAYNRFVGRVDSMLGETKLAYDPAAQAKTLRDALGHETVYRYDLLGNITSITNPLGHVTTYQFGDSRFPDKATRVTNHLGESVRTTYNTQGLASTVTDPLGRVTTYVYDSAGRLLTETDALGHAVTRTYDSRGNVLTSTDRGGAVTTYTYDAAGNPLTVADALDNVSTFTYNSLGLPITESEADSTGTVLASRAFSYDLAGNLLTETIQQIGSDGSVRPRTTSHTYDAAGRLRTTTYPDGRVATRTYAASGQLATETTPDRGLVSYTYDAAEQLKRVTFSGGSTELTDYDPVGRVTKRTDRGGFVTSYIYDAAGRLTTEALPDGGRIVRAYDAAGRLVSETDDAGRITATAYDAAGNPTAITHPDGTSTTLTYDAVNNVSTRSVRAFAEPEFAALGGYARTIAALGGHPDAYRLAQAGGSPGGSAVDPSGTPARLFRFTYDANRRITEVLHPDGSTRATLEYDFLGRPIRVTNERGATWTYEYQGGSAMRRTRVAGPEGYVENYEYDAYANIIVQTDARGRRIETIYDDVKPARIKFHDIAHPAEFTSLLNTYDSQSGRLRSIRDRRSFETSFDYPTAGKPDRDITRTEGANGFGQSHLTRERYDARGNLIEVTDARGSVTAYEYDAFNRRTLVTHPDGIKERTVYGPGNTVARTELIPAMGDALATSYGYDDNGRLSAITHPDGATEHLSFDADGRITGRVDERGNATTYRYDDTARTVTVTDALLGVTRHAFDAVGNLLETTDARGHRTVFTYDLLGRQISRTEAADTNVARTTRFEYDLNGNVTARIEAAGTSEARTTRYAYDADNRLLLTTFADGSTIRTEHDVEGNLIAQTNERGFVTRYDYDAFGRLTRLIDPLDHETTYAYPDFGARAVRTDPLGRVFTDHFDSRQRLAVREFDGGAWVENLNYDAFGRLSERRERRAAAIPFTAARVTAYAYDARGRVSGVTHPSGGVERFDYDDAGNLSQVTDPRGFATAFAYDRLNRRTLETRRGAANEADRATVFEYDPVGNLTRLTKPGGQVLTRVYDPRGRVTDLAATLSPTESYQQTLSYDRLDRLSGSDDGHGPRGFTYDLRDRLLSETDPLGHTRVSTYDPAGNRLTATDERGFSSSFVYDKLNRVVSASIPGGTIRTYEFDAAGRLTNTKIAGAGTAAVSSPERGVRFDYDGLDRVILTEQLSGIDGGVLSSESSTFDGEGRLLTGADGEGHVTEHAYSASGFLASVTFADSSSRSWTHDVVGNVLTAADELGHVTRTAYNGFGELASVTDALGHDTTYAYDVEGRLARVEAPLARVTTHDYDLAGRRTSTVLPDGSSLAFAYDLFGNLTSRTDQAGRETRYTYDALDRLLSASAPIDATHRATASYTYDAAGNLATITDPLNRVTRFEHDPAGRLAATFLPLRPENAHERRTYDHSGNLVDLTDGNGHVTRHGYDARGLLRTVAPDGTFGQPPILHAYDGRGLRTSMTDRFGATSYSYDTRGRLTAKSTPYAGALSYGYDGAGRLTSLASSAPDGLRMAYGYDAADRLVSATDSRLGATSYAYDAADRLIGQTQPSGLRSTRAYDAMDRLLSVETRAGASPTAAVVESYTYTRTLTGQIASELAANGRSETYAYDHSDRLVRQIITGDSSGQNGTLDYTLDAIGNRRARVSTVPGLPAQDFDYDANHAIEGYAYDGQGNPVSGAAPGSSLPAPGSIADSYDFRHALAAREAQVTYLYDGDGERIGRRVWNPVARAWDDTFYLNDSLPSAANPLGLSQTVEERASGGALQRLYSPAPQRLAVAERHALASAGGAFSVALAADGTVLAWGDNSAGQLGDGSALAARATPAVVPGLSNITRVVAGSEFAAALRADGTLFWWGRLGAAEQATPVALADLPPLSSVAAGADFVVALAADGTVWTFGDNSTGQRGTGDLQVLAVPTQVGGLADIVEVAAGAVHALALDSVGHVHSWGGNIAGQLGSPAYTALASTLPLAVPGLSGVVELSGGARHTLALDLDGVVYAWGDNTTGQLGDGTRATRAAVQPVSGLGQTAVSIAAGGWHSLAALADGTVRAWGSHAEGQAAGALSASTGDQLTPATVAGLAGVTRVAAGARQSFALTSSGQWYGWGSNREGQLGLTGAVGGATPVALSTVGLVDVAGGHDAAPMLAVAQGTRYYGYDAQGSVRYQTDATGAVTARYDYDAFGTLLGASGESPVGSDAYLYRGERYDALTGLYHLRSRDYDPVLGRFHQIDDFAGFADNPYSLNRYNYAESNPVGNFDPAGRFAVTSLVSAVYALHIKDQYLAELASAGPQFTFDPDEALSRYSMTDMLVAAGAPLKLKERELWVRASAGGLLGSWVNDSGSSEGSELPNLQEKYVGGRGFGAGSDVFFLHQNGARFRQGWAVKQIEQAWGALQQSRLSLNMGPRFPDDPRSRRIADGNVRLKGTRWADAIYADALLQATLRSAATADNRGVRAHFTPTVEGRRYDATGIDLTVTAMSKVAGANGRGWLNWQDGQREGAPDRHLVAARVGQTEEEFAAIQLDRAAFHEMLRNGINNFQREHVSGSAEFYHEWGDKATGLSAVGLSALGSAAGFAENFPSLVGSLIAGMTGNYLSAVDAGANLGSSLIYAGAYTLVSPFVGLGEAVSGRDAMTNQVLGNGARSDRYLAGALAVFGGIESLRPNAKLAKPAGRALPSGLVADDFVSARPIKNVTPLADEGAALSTSAPPPMLPGAMRPKALPAAPPRLALPEHAVARAAENAGRVTVDSVSTQVSDSAVSLTGRGAYSYDYLVHMAQNTLDFSTKKNGAVFWSTPRMLTAQKWAQNKGKTTLEQTIGGQFLSDLDLFEVGSGLASKQQAAYIWDIASARFTKGASGTVNVFSTGATKISPYTGQLRTWWRIELPGLRANPNVDRIIRRRVDGGQVGDP